MFDRSRSTTAASSVDSAGSLIGAVTLIIVIACPSNSFTIAFLELHWDRSLIAQRLYRGADCTPVKSVLMCDSVLLPPSRSSRASNWTPKWSVLAVASDILLHSSLVAKQAWVRR